MKRLLVSTATVLAAAALVLALFALPATARPVRAQDDLLATYQQLLDAFSAGDIDGAVAFFTDDAVVESSTCTPPCVGKEEIRGWLDGLNAGNFQILSPASGDVSDNTLTARWEAKDPELVPAAGVERIVVMETVEFTGDKISSLSSGFDVTDEQTATFLAFLEAQAELPATGGLPPTSEGGFPWSYLLIATGTLVLLSGGAVTLRLRRQRIGF